MKIKEDRKSLCEESMLVLVNILKLSSLSLARRTLFTKSTDDDQQGPRGPIPKRPRPTIINQNPSSSNPERSFPPLIPVPKSQKSKRLLQKPEQSKTQSKLSYVLLPDSDEVATSASSYVVSDHHDDQISTVDGQFSDYIRRFHEKTENDLKNAIVEGKAANYIKRFHEKNMSDLNNESMRRVGYVLPPPPRKVFN